MKETKNVIKANRYSSVDNKFLVDQLLSTVETIDSLDLRKKKDKAIMLNSLLSLIVLPLETIKKTGTKSRVFEESFNGMSQKLGMHPVVFQPIHVCNGQNIKYERRTIYAFMRKFRNSIAHQNMRPSNDEKSIYFYNLYLCGNTKTCCERVCEQKGLSCQKGAIKDFEIQLNYIQIRKISKYIAKAFLNY